MEENQTNQHTTLIPTEKRIYRKQLRNFKREFKNYLLTSLFNNTTWEENQRFRNQHSEVGCVYCAPDPISCQIPNESILFILEMNNDTNRIMGIGMVRNHSILGKYFVYNEDNYNRYVYIGKTRIDRSEMTKEEERIMTVFDILCFNGNKHMKRGQGIKSFPTDMLYRMNPILDLVSFIGKMFKTRLSNKK
jgi:hypothetical protein